MPDAIELPEITVTPGDEEGEGGGSFEETPKTTETNVRLPRRPGSKEIAILEVRGQQYSNWTSVRVEQRVTQPFPLFQFECTEEVPVPLDIRGAQFVPGDVVRVFLGGHSAVFGYIQERHVGYDARNHGVRLIGVGDTVDLVQSSVPLAQLGNHDGKNVTQLARDLSAHLGTQIHTYGAVDPVPYEKIQVLPGESIIQTIERYAKPRNIVIGSVANGGLLLIGEHPVKTSGYLWEGTNILRANCVVRDNMVHRHYLSIGQDSGSDSANGDPQNKQVAHRPGTSTRNRHLLVVMDVADKYHGVQRRAAMEEVFTEGSTIEAHITVQGWFKDLNRSEDIWRAGEYYAVNSPSLILNDAVLGCSGCVYEQNNAGGTTTTLQMVKPIHMNGRLNFLAEDMALRTQRLREIDAARKRAAEVTEAQRILDETREGD